MYINISVLFTGPGLLLRGGRYDIALWSFVHQSQYERAVIPVLRVDRTMCYHDRGGGTVPCMYTPGKIGLLT